VVVPREYTTQNTRYIYSKMTSCRDARDPKRIAPSEICADIKGIAHLSRSRGGSPRDTDNKLTLLPTHTVLTSACDTLVLMCHTPRKKCFYS
jgi:hypothetical protein